MRHLRWASILISTGSLNIHASGNDAGGQPAAPSQMPASLQRQISIRAYEVFQQRKLRLYVTVDESDASSRFMLNTLDARAFQLQSTNPAETPIEPTSLSTFSARSPAIHRETAVVFQAHQTLAREQFDLIRAGVAGFLGGLRSDVLSVRSSTAERESRIAWTAPGQSANPRAIQKSVLESPVLEGRPGIAAGVCAATQELDSENEAVRGQQKNLVLISMPVQEKDEGWSEVRRCVIRAAAQNVRVFWIRLRGEDIESPQRNEAIETAVTQSGGFVTRLSQIIDPSAALNNVRSWLDDEYVLEFDLTQHQPYSDTLKFKLKANYHGNIFRTAEREFEGFTAQPRPEELARLEYLRALERKKNQQSILFVAFVLVGSAAIIFMLLRRNSTGCSKCGFRVSKSFQDCPFRNPKCQGRLSLIQGGGVGREYPLFVGENTIGRRSANTIRIEQKGIRGREGKIVITKRKALFYPEKGSQTRVNGVIATEPRLLASGTLLRIGEHVWRVDFKEGA